jgi:hypothetical protein
MLEVYHLPPTDPSREARLLDIVTKHKGDLVYKEAPELDGNHNVCLTYELVSESDAQQAALQIREIGEHVEGPGLYS